MIDLWKLVKVKAIEILTKTIYREHLGDHTYFSILAVCCYLESASEVLNKNLLASALSKQSRTSAFTCGNRLIKLMETQLELVLLHKTELWSDGMGAQFR